ncbi:MAG: hypothetical protein GX783_13025 [Clostridiales bacterium]|nr:hypothetical protein [Clostridiales bacterium]
MSERNYFINEPEDDNKSVELWSKIRLPFEPKGWLLEMRNSLRSRLRTMHNSENTMLQAQYVSNEEGYFDVENVLIYNVGSGSFTDLCRRGLCFERVFSLPIQPKNIEEIFPHYQRYSLIDPSQGSLYWAKEQILAYWTEVSCPDLKGDIKPHSFWYAIKSGTVEVIDKLKLPSYFGLKLKINAPRGTRINLASVIKPLLDGIISGFHSHDGSYNPIVVGRLTRSLGEEESHIERMLMEQSKAVLGIRNLVHPFGTGIQWNPGDDFCVAAKVVIDDCIVGTSWSLEGELFTVVPCSY